MKLKKYRACRRFIRFLPLYVVVAACVASSLPALADFPGGFVEKGVTATVRSRLAPSQIRAFLPARGAFTFPAPYNTQGIRITNASDCNGGDCLYDVGYSYWRNINNHVGSNTMYIFLGLNKS